MKPGDVLTVEERELLLQRSDVQAWIHVLGAWILIFGILMLVGYFPSVFTLLLAWIVLPGRQLSLAVLMHEAGHGSLFKTKSLNAWVGQWLCALPTLGDLESYARGHAPHHRFAFFGVRLVQPVPVPESPHLYAGPEPCLQDL